MTNILLKISTLDLRVYYFQIKPELSKISMQHDLSPHLSHNGVFLRVRTRRFWKFHSTSAKSPAKFEGNLWGATNGKLKFNIFYSSTGPLRARRGPGTKVFGPPLH